MPVSDIYSGNALVQPKSIQDFNNDNMLMQGKRQQLQQGNLALQESQMKLQQNANMMQQRQGLQQAIQSGQVDLNNQQHQANLVAQFPDAAPAFLSSVQASKTASALAEKDSGAGAASQAEAQTKNYGLLKNATSVISANPSPDVVNSVLTQYAQMTGQPVETTRQLFAQAGNDPAKIKQLADGFGISADQHMTDQTTRRNADVSSQTQLTTNAATNSAHIQAAGIAASTSRQNNAANIGKDYAIAGLGPDGKDASGGTGGLAPVAIENAAQRYNVDGTLPAQVGRGQQGPRDIRSVLNRAGELAVGNGTDQRIAQLDNKSSAAALTQLQRAQAMSGSFEKTANANADLALGLSAKMDRTGIPILNAGLQAWKTGTGSPEATQFAAANATFVGEYAKIMSGGMGGGPTSDSARHKAETLLTTAMTQSQYQGNVKLLQTEMQNRMKGYDDQITQVKSKMGGSSPAAPATVTSSTVPPDIAAILQKHGGK